MISWQKNRRLGPSSQMDSCSAQPLSGTPLKDSGEGNSSQWAEHQELHLATYFAWKDRLPDL